MTDLPTLLTCLLFLAIALLYACAGQAGASGYIAVMALLGYAPESIKPTALILNTLVSLVVSWRFVKDKHFDWPLFWPFALGALPLALLGGYLTLTQQWFEYLLGVLLLTAGGLSFLRKPAAETQPQAPRRSVAYVWGALIGLMSGLTGVGGGVLITPLLLFFNWSGVRTAASVSALFILLNSVVALIGHWSATSFYLPEGIGVLAVMAVAGGLLGARLGSRVLTPSQIRLVLGVILIVAGLKMILSA